MLYSTIENADPDFPRLHELDLVKIGADNPDNVYLSANIRGDRTYRITGTRGTIAYFSIGSKANRYAKDGTMASTGELTDDDLVVEPDGTVEIIASATPHGQQLAAAGRRTRPASWCVRPTSTARTETPGSWRIERIGEPAAAAARSTRSSWRKALQRRGAVACTARRPRSRSWTEMFMTRPNELPDFGQEMFQRAGGDPEIFYLHGYWTLEPGRGVGDRDRRARTARTGTSSSTTGGWSRSTTSAGSPSTSTPRRWTTTAG